MCMYSTSTFYACFWDSRIPCIACLGMERGRGVLYTGMLVVYDHVISLSAQPINIQKAQSRKKAHKPLHTFCVSPIMCLNMFDNHACNLVYFLRISKPFACSCCVICISCPVHLILAYYVHKGSWAFYLNYPQINEGRQSDRMEE